jgi:hypothetical protein
MKKLCLALASLAASLLFCVNVQSQTITLKGASTPTLSVALTWTAPVASGALVACNATNICEYTVYRISGACPATLVGSGGWTALGTTADSVLDYADSTVAPLTEYSYVVEAVLMSDLQQSNPSNCYTVTTGSLPLVPNAPTVLQ